ncbi:class I SAM-dependent methyltransferase [bacterium]|nr:class I SAM-dependent methyltransferase [bacterium]MBU1989326.1 class I SAM-dependent methyltransferase [bacterium]
MPRIDSEKFYTSAIKVHGTTAKGVNWYSKESQELRFDIILEMLPHDLSALSIADAGCGFGDFYTYMCKKKKKPKKYIGLDSLADMYCIASEQTGCEIILADICKEQLPHADFYVCSGAMNVLNEFETHLFIRNCFAACGIGFVFNILHGDKDSETYNYISTCRIEEMAKELNVSHVQLRKDYLEDDITVAFLKKDI